MALLLLKLASKDLLEHVGALSGHGSSQERTCSKKGLKPVILGQVLYLLLRGKRCACQSNSRPARIVPQFRPDDRLTHCLCLAVRRKGTKPPKQRLSNEAANYFDLLKNRLVISMASSQVVKAAIFQPERRQ